MDAALTTHSARCPPPPGAPAVTSHSPPEELFRGLTRHKVQHGLCLDHRVPQARGPQLRGHGFSDKTFPANLGWHVHSKAPAHTPRPLNSMYPVSLHSLVTSETRFPSPEALLFPGCRADLCITGQSSHVPSSADEHCAHHSPAFTQNTPSWLKGRTGTHRCGPALGWFGNSQGSPSPNERLLCLQYHTDGAPGRKVISREEGKSHTKEPRPT